MGKRILAILLRQLFLYKRSIHRVLGIVYWPALELFIWGFLTVFLNQVGGAEFNFIPVLLGALIFWDLFNRAGQAISISFLEEVWSRNLGNVFASPLRPLEYLTGLIILSILQAVVAIGFMSSLAFMLWQMDLFSFGFYLVPFIINLFFLGWTIGIITTALVLRLGPSVDILAWSLPVLIQPVSAVFYPVSVLPLWLQKIAWWLPTSHVFEGMRAAVLDQMFDWTRLWWSLGLNTLYFILALFFFQFMYYSVRKRGLLQRYAD